MKNFWLSIHADYACRHSGACCTSRWPIPVEADILPRLEEALARGEIEARAAPFSRPAGLADGVAAILGTTERGACVFYDPGGAAGRCRVHRALGHGALPSSCRHFPRVCLADPRGVSVTLSHYCPTVARLPFREDRPLAIVEGPDPVPGEEAEGLDARKAWPPRLTPNVLMDHDGYARWEKAAVSILAADGAGAEDALALLAAQVERLRAWRPGGVPLASAIEAAGRGAAEGDAVGRASRAPHLAAFEETRRCVPAPWTWEDAPRATHELWRERIAAGWPALARPVRFFLAARLFAAWTAYQGEGLRSVVRSLESALAVLKVETVRLAARTNAELDADLLREAFRRTDLLLVHLADRDELSRAWSRAETRRGGTDPTA